MDMETIIEILFIVFVVWFLNTILFPWFDKLQGTHNKEYDDNGKEIK